MVRSLADEFRFLFDRSRAWQWQGLFQRASTLAMSCGLNSQRSGCQRICRKRKQSSSWNSSHRWLLDPWAEGDRVRGWDGQEDVGRFFLGKQIQVESAQTRDLKCEVYPVNSRIVGECFIYVEFSFVRFWGIIILITKLCKQHNTGSTAGSFLILNRISHGDSSIGGGRCRDDHRRG